MFFKMLYLHSVLVISLNFKSLYAVQISNYRNSIGTEKHNNKRLILHKGNQPRMFCLKRRCYTNSGKRALHGLFGRIHDGRSPRANPPDLSRGHTRSPVGRI